MVGHLWNGSYSRHIYIYAYTISFSGLRTLTIAYKIGNEITPQGVTPQGSMIKTKAWGMKNLGCLCTLRSLRVCHGARLCVWEFGARVLKSKGDFSLEKALAINQACIFKRYYIHLFSGLFTKHCQESSELVIESSIIFWQADA